LVKGKNNQYKANKKERRIEKELNSLGFMCYMNIKD